MKFTLEARAHGRGHLEWVCSWILDGQPLASGAGQTPNEAVRNCLQGAQTVLGIGLGPARESAP